MHSLLFKTCLSSLVLLASLSVCQLNHVAADDIISVDISGVAPQYVKTFKDAEAFWESRIKNYSTSLPRAILVQLTQLRIVATTPLLDGPGGLLGQAGPRATLSYESTDLFRPRRSEVPVMSMMQFDLGDLDRLDADGSLVRVVIHEMGHALGFGSLWTQNRLIGPVAGVGAVQYINGQYALEQYRRETNNLLAPFVPLEQRGGGGSALSHWAENEFFDQTFQPAFKKEILTAFRLSLDPNSNQPVLANSFFSETSWGAMADLGYEVSGINDNTSALPERFGTGRWPKITGAGLDPFVSNGVPPAAGLSFKLVDITIPTRMLGDKIESELPGDIEGVDVTDPHKLRFQRWVK